MRNFLFISIILLCSSVIAEEKQTFRFTERVYDSQQLNNESSKFASINIASRLSQIMQEIGFLHEPDEITNVIIDYDIRENTHSALPGSISSTPDVAMIRAYRDGADAMADIRQADLVYFEISLPAAALSPELRSELIDEAIQLFKQKIAQALNLHNNHTQLSSR